MPSLEVNGPELQALDAIRSFVVPLIDSSIAESIKMTKNLVVRNSLDLLRFELHSLTFYITKGHELKDQEYEAFLQDLQPVLQLLEDFIHPQAAWPSTGEIRDPTSLNERRRYPKLHAIIQKASQSKDHLDLKAAINLPDSGDAARAACDIVTKFNANNHRRDNGDRSEFAHTQTDEKSTDFHVNHPCIQQSRLCSSMFKAWAHHFGASGCHYHHVGMLQACAVENGPEPQKVVQHKMFISTCKPKDKWQEVTCTIVGNLPEHASSLCEIEDICQTIGNSLSDEETLSLWICSGRIWHDSEDDPRLVENLHILPTLSLQRILEKDTCRLGQNGSVTLAYNLACTLLQLYSADMQQQEWGPGDIYFLHNPTEGTIHEPDYPFVASTFLSNRAPSEIKNRFPVLIHFAKLLLEIGLGQLFVPRRSRLDFELMKWAQSAEANQSLIGSYLDAVMECLQAKKPSLPAFPLGRSQMNTSARADFHGGSWNADTRLHSCSSGH